MLPAAVVGRLCERSESAEATNIRETCGSMESYMAELRMEEPECASGAAGTFTWMPDEDTPDIVYYQVSARFYRNNVLGNSVVSTH